MNTNPPDAPPPNDERHINTTVSSSSPAIITPDSPKNNYEEKTPTITTKNNNSMNGSSSLISLVAEDDTIPRDVRWKKEHRQFTDKTFAYMFIICYITFILSTIYVYVGAQPKYVPNGSGQSIISPYYANDVASCCAERTTKKQKIGYFDLCTEKTTTTKDDDNNNNNENKISPDIETYNESNPRSLMYLPSTPRDHHHHTTTTTLLRGDEGIFEAFLDAPHIIICLLILTIILAVTWAILLQRAASHIVWATEAMKVGLLIYLGRRAAAVDDNVGTRNLCYGLATIQMIYSYKFRTSLRLAGEILSRSSTALLSMGRGNNKVVVGCGIVFLAYVANSWMFVVFYSKGYQHARVERVETCSSNDDGGGGGDCVSSCVFTYPSYMNTIYVVNCFVYGWSVFLLSQIRLSTIATIVGSWHFDDKANNNNNNKERPSITRALINSTTTSLGTLSIAALISTICDYFNKELKKPCWKRWMMGGGGMMFCCFVSPVQLLLCFFGTALEMLIKMFSKFAVIVHVFTGLAYYDAGRKASKIMSRHFVGGFVTEATSESVLNLGCYVFSIGIMFLAWAWFDMAFGMDTLGLENVTSYVMMMVWVLFGLFNLWYPVLGIYLIILVNRYLQAWEEIKMRVHDEINESDAADKIVWGEWVQLLSTSTQRYWLSPLAAIFVGCVSMMFFTYVAGVFKDTIDVMFMCYAIDKDNNIDMSSSEMHSLAMAMGDDVVIAQPVLEQEHEKNFGKFYKNL